MPNLLASRPLNVMYQCLFEMTFDQERAKVRRLLKLETERFRLFVDEHPGVILQDLRDIFASTDFSISVRVIKRDHQERLLNQDRLLSGWAPQIKLTPSIMGLYRLKLVDTYPYLFHGRNAKADANVALIPYKLALESRGFDTYLCPGKDDLQLWSDCKPWMFDAVLRQMTPAEFRKEVDDGCDAISQP